MANEETLLETPEIETPEPSLRDSIALAIDEHAETPEVKPAATVAAPVADPAKPAATVAAPVADPAKPAAPVVPAAKAPAVGADGKPVPAVQELKPPTSWKPAVREKWATLPREVQEEIHRRESDNLRLIGSVGPKIRFADTMSQHLQPFAQHLSSQGVGPDEFIGEVMGSIKTLAAGTPQDKVDVVANMIQSYGIDLRMLDAALTSRIKLPPEVMEARRLAAQAQRVIDGQRTQTQQQAVQQQAHSASTLMDDFAKDPKNEFFEDVRTMMADLLETGQSKNLADAYTASIWANPDTRKILLQREADARVKTKQHRANVARGASLSVGGAPRSQGGAPVIGQNMSLRETISEAIDLHSE